MGADDRALPNYPTNLRSVLLLVDFRHPPTEDDVTMAQWLQYYRLPYAVIATKRQGAVVSNAKIESSLESV